MHQKVLILGGTGLIGKAIEARQHDYPQTRFVFWGSKNCDLTREEESLRKIDECKPDAIIHLAGYTLGIGSRTKHAASILRKNTLMNINVLEAARLYRTEKVVMTLSTAMYPDSAPSPIKEDYIHDGPANRSNYGYLYSKRLVEPMIRAYRSEYDLNVIGLVPNWLFGEHDNFNYEDAGVLPALIRRFCENKNTQGKIVIWGDGSPLREYTYSDDVARAYLWSLENYDDGHILNVGTTEEHSIKQMAFMLAEILGIDTGRIEFDTSQPNGALRKCTDNSRFVALSHFNYTPLWEGLQKTVKWYCSHLERSPESIRTGRKVRLV